MDALLLLGKIFAQLLLHVAYYFFINFALWALSWLMTYQPSFPLQSVHIGFLFQKVACKIKTKIACR